MQNRPYICLKKGCQKGGNVPLFFWKWRVSLLDDFRSLLIDTYVNFISNFEVAPFIIPSTLPEVSLSFLGANTYLLQPFDWCLLLNSCHFLHHFLGGNHLVRMTKSITVGCYDSNNPVQLKREIFLTSGTLTVIPVELGLGSISASTEYWSSDFPFPKFKSL